jgi:AcrR family transcriptional regulator
MNDVAVEGKPGLRERKKAKTRAAIQEQALRLFREQGYSATTVEEIAEAAEVSPSTFFRYFGTKEDVILYDAMDPIILAAFIGQPPELSPMQAIRKTVVETFGSLTPEQTAESMVRARLMYSEPELRSAVIMDTLRTSALFADAIAERIGRRADDFELRVFVGALMGAMMASFLPMLEGRPTDLIGSMDRALAMLEDGLKL